MSQIIINAIIRAAELGLLAIGITMIFKILRFANFAHSEFAVLGAYLAYFFSVTVGLPLLWATVLAVPLTGLVAVLCDYALFARIRTSPGLVLLIAAMGLSLFLRNMVATLWGVDALSYKEAYAKSYMIFGGYITSTQIIIVIAASVAMILFHLLLTYTRFGKAMRAMSDNKELAKSRGIKVERVIKQVWFIVGCYAGLGGVLIALETLLAPEMGFNIMLPVFCAAILGGIGNIYGAMVGGLIIGLAENLLIAIDWSIPLTWIGLIDGAAFIYLSTGYKIAISFIILSVVLIFMPRGIMKGETGD